MVFGLTFMPVYADDSNEMAMSIVFTDTNFDPISIAKEGQTIYIGIKIDNYQPICAYSWRFDYDPELMEFDSSYDYSQEYAPGVTVSLFKDGVYQVSTGLNPSTTNIKGGIAIANFAKQTNVESLTGEIAFYLAFTVKSTGQITADFNRENYGNFTWRTASVDDNSKYTDINTTETDGKLNVVSTGVYLSQNEVTVNGTDSVTVTAYAFDKDVNDITNSVTWSLAFEGNGVTIDGNTITVAANADAGHCTITATATDGTFGDNISNASFTFSIKRAPSTAKSITLTGSTDPITVPGNNEEDATATFTASVVDQYGETMTAPDITWSVSPKVEGISIVGGKLTVTNAAKAGITDTTGTEFTVTATCGDVNDTATVIVKRAASACSSIEILKNDDAIDSDNVAAGEKGNYTAQYYDQYGYPMDPVPGTTPTWEISETDNCESDDFTLTPVSSDNERKVEVTVDGKVKNGASATLKVSENDLSDSITINVNAIEFTAEEGAITYYYKDSEDGAYYGLTWGELVQIDQSKITATYNGEKIEGTYYIKVSQDFGSTYDDVNLNDRPVCDPALYMCSIYFDSADRTFEDIYVAKHCTNGTSINVPDISFTLNPKPVTVTGITAADKVYNGDTSATLVTDKAAISGTVGDDVVTINADNAAGTFDTKNVGNGKTVTINGLALSGNDAANYTLSTVTATGNITAKEITANVSGVSVTKEYDGTTAAGTVSGAATAETGISGETVTVNVSAGEYADKNVGNDKSVTLTLSLSGDNASNYTLSNTTVEIYNAEITAKDVTKSEDFAQNVVVGVGTFTAPKFTGIGGEEVTGTVTYSYDGKTSYDEIVNALKSLSEGQTATFNYTFTADGNYSGEITGTITVTMVDIVFTVGTETATADNAVTIKEAPTYGDDWSEIVTIKENDIVASLNGETLTGGAYSLNVSGMPTASEQSYTVQYTYGDKTYNVCTGTVTVAQKELTITGLSAADKPYDGNTTATVSGIAVLNGVLAGDTVTVTTGTAAFDSKNAGAQTVTFSGYGIEGASASNYVLSAQPASVTATISPKPVTITGVTAENKTYDGNTTATIDNPGTINGIISPDTVTIKAGTGTFASADVGENIEVTFSGFSLTGTDSGNYTLSAQPASTTANITKANYTGTPNTVNVNVLINQDAAQTGSVSLDQFFQTIPAGAVITSVAPASGSVMASVSVADGVISYSSKANLETEGVTDAYSVTIETKNYNNITATLTFTTVAKTPVNISGVSVTGAGKTYDGKSVSYTGTPAAKTNDGKTVTVTGTYSYVWQEADGTALASAPKDAGSYKLVITLDDPAYIGSAEVSFTIAKAKITITAEDAEAYTGSDMPKLSYTVTGLATGESLAVNPTLTCNADMDKPGEYAITASGAAVPATGNYNETITYVPGTLTVSRRPINVGPTYDIDVVDSDNGSVKASLGNASEGSVITLTVTPDDGYKLGSITVIDENGDEVEVRRSGSEYKFTMPDSDVRVSARFVRDTGALPFNDVNAGDWFYDYVEYVYNNGIMDGVDNGVFSPNTETTRGMVVTILYRLAGEPNVRGGNDFSDVASGAYYADAVTWASNAGIVNGTSATTFSPNALVTREQFAAMLYRYMSYIGEDVSASTNLNRYTDADSVSAYAETAMSWAVAEGIINGRTATTLAPAGNCTRAEVAAMITRVFG